MLHLQKQLGKHHGLVTWTTELRRWEPGIHDQAQPIGNYETARKLFTKLWALTLKNLNDSESLFQL